ncbi:MAG: hypothetical protein U0792_24255 [Gemmataceae bacterium]
MKRTTALPRFILVAVLGFVVFCFASLVGIAEPPTDAEMLTPFPHPKGYVCYRAEPPITIDGDLNEAAWEAQAWTEAFADIEEEGRKPPLRTS